MPYASIFKPPSFAQLREMPDAPLQVTRRWKWWSTPARMWTSAPVIIISTVPTWPTCRSSGLHGQGVVWRIAAQPNQQIDVDQLKPRARA